MEALVGLLDAFGNCSTRLNQNASRFTMLFTLDYDSSGMLTSGSLQVGTIAIGNENYELVCMITRGFHHSVD